MLDHAQHCVRWRVGLERMVCVEVGSVVVVFPDVTIWISGIPCQGNHSCVLVSSYDGNMARVDLIWVTILL